MVDFAAGYRIPMTALALHEQTRMKMELTVADKTDMIGDYHMSSAGMS